MRQPITTNNNQPTWSWSQIPDAAGYRYSFTNGADWTETPELAYTSASALTDGTYTLYVQACDDVGNWSASGYFATTVNTSDMSVPVVSVIAVTNNRTPVWTWNTSGTASVNIDLTAPGSPVVSGDAVTSDTTPTWSWTTPVGTHHFS